MSDFRRLIYQNLHEQKSALERAANLVRLRELEAETHKNELELKAANSTIDFNFDSEGNPKLKRDTMTRLGRDTAPNQQLETLPDAGAVKKWLKPDDEKEFNLKSGALRRWMISKGLEPDADKTIFLKHHEQFKDYTKHTLYNELCGFDNAFLVSEPTFNDFWQKQKLLKFK